jgi:glycerol-3-phosphate acyltransferase PlsX
VRIAIDVMGGDHAPDKILLGALQALPLLSEHDRLVLVGDEEVIRDEMLEQGVAKDPRIEVEPTTEVIAMDDPPVSALRAKSNSSINRMAWLGSKRAGQRQCDVVISAGNTGACVAAAQKYMRRLSGVNRPGVAVTIPTFSGPVVICDVGANPEPRPHHLHQYAHMAQVYAQRVTGIAQPRSALLSIGSEEAKGNALVKDAAPLLKDDPNLNYVGYIEGREIFDNGADLVITEGFTGNVVLKLSEGLASGLFKTIAREIFEVDPQLALRFEPVVKNIYKKHDYHEYGGAPLLGANGVCLICHGSSEARTITAAVRSAMIYMDHDVNGGIVQALSKLKPVREEAPEGANG